MFEASAGEGGDDDETVSREAQPSAKKAKRDWLEGVPHLKTIQQLFKEKAGKDGFEVLGEVKGEELLNRPYAGPFDEVTLDGQPVTPQPGELYGGWITADVVGPFNGGPGSWGW